MVMECPRYHRCQHTLDLEWQLRSNPVSHLKQIYHRPSVGLDQQQMGLVCRRHRTPSANAQHNRALRASSKRKLHASGSGRWARLEFFCALGRAEGGCNASARRLRRQPSLHTMSHPGSDQHKGPRRCQCRTNLLNMSRSETNLMANLGRSSLQVVRAPRTAVRRDHVPHLVGRSRQGAASSEVWGVSPLWIPQPASRVPCSYRA